MPSPSDFNILFERARAVIKKFAAHDAKPWSASDKMLDFSAHVGKFAEAVLEREGLKSRSGKDAVEEELGVLLFILFDLAETYGVSFGSALEQFIESAERDGA
jgi:NTP pyrophosphatase (non-canonical NTP hydrolase)